MRVNPSQVAVSARSRLARTTMLIVRAVISKEIARTVSEPLKTNIIKSADNTISYIADDYCGTGTGGRTKRPPKTMPGPRGPGINLAIAVAAFAHVTAVSENVREELMSIAGNLTQKAYEE